MVKKFTKRVFKTQDPVFQRYEIQLVKRSSKKERRVDALSLIHISEAHWYVVHTYSGYENKVKANIDKTIENRHLEDQILSLIHI